MTISSEWKRSRLAYAIGCVVAGTAFSVQAQDENTNDEANVEEAQERIQVLGSRIRTDGLDQAAPVEIILAEEAVSQGMVTLGDLLRASTVAAGSNQVTAAASTAFVTAGGTGTETLSLRGLGANRTLVLLNGRRIGPAGTRGQVSAFDLNIMPLSAVQQVEILKDGASSLYGSDAVAGVVNIITKQGDESNFNINTSQPTEAGGETLRINGTFGRSYDNGSFRVVADFNKINELAMGDREFFNCAQNYVFDPDTGARADTVDPRTGDFHCNDLLWGHVWIYDYAGDDSNVPGGALAQYDYDGDLGQYVPSFNDTANDPADMRTPEGWFPVAYDQPSFGVANADHPFQDLESLSPEQEIATLFANGEFWASDTMTLYGEVLLNRRKTTTNGYRQFWNYQYNENFFAGNSLSEGWTGAQWFSPTAITDHSGSEITVDYRRFVVGAEGYLGDWFWDVNYQDSRSDGDYKNKIIFGDAIYDWNFSTGSCEGQTTSYRGVDCIDVPWLDPQFLAGNITGDVRDFLFGTETGNTVYDQRTVEAVISGDLFTWEAGTAGAAFGVSYQQDEIVDTPGEHTLNANTWGSSSAGITAGKSSTKAIFAEVSVPLLRDAPFAERLELTASARYTDVSTYGGDSTYKVAMNWLISDGFRVRASQGTSFRAPALYELYLNDQTAFASQRSVDPCINYGLAFERNQISELVRDNCAADGIPPDFGGGAISATVFTSGGLGQLEAETSTARTAGIVWLPEWTDFSASVDYFEIEIDGEVTLLSGGQTVFGCYSSENFESEPLCDKFIRNETDGRVEEVYTNYLNIANQTSRGIDIQLNYPMQTDFADFNFTYEHTVQLESSSQLFPTSDVIERQGEFGSPEHVGNFRAAMMLDDWEFNWTARYIGSVSNHERYGLGEYRDDATLFGNPVRVVLGADAVIYHALSVTKEFRNEGLDVTLGVANIFDKEPPKASSIGGVTRLGNTAFYSQYDWLGRRVFLNLSYRF